MRLPPNLLLCLSTTQPALALLALPVPETTNPANATFNRSLSDSYDCFPWAHFLLPTRRAKYDDCAAAYAWLPNLHNEGTFYRGGNPATDPFALPRVDIDGNCQVKIDIQPRALDTSSWVAIGIAVNKIIGACKAGTDRWVTTGGMTTAGSEGRINITVEKSTERPSLIFTGR